MKLVKATSEEKRVYAQGKPVYPLYGWVTWRKGRHNVNLRVAVEYVGEGLDQPNYEAIAPAGYHFDNGDVLHTLIAVTQADLMQRLRSSTLELCTEACKES